MSEKSNQGVEQLTILDIIKTIPRTEEDGDRF